MGCRSVGRQQTGHMEADERHKHRRGGTHTHRTGTCPTVSSRLPPCVQRVCQLARSQADRQAHSRHRQSEGGQLFIQESDHCPNHRRELQPPPLCHVRLHHAHNATPAEAGAPGKAREVHRCGVATQPDELRVQERILNTCGGTERRMVRLSVVHRGVPQGGLPRDVPHQPVPAQGTRGRL